MLIRLDESILLDALERVKHFKGKARMQDFVKERLDKSLKLYEYELDNECHLIKKLKPKTISKTLKNIS